MAKQSPTPERIAMLGRWLEQLDKHVDACEREAQRLETGYLSACASALVNGLLSLRSLDSVTLPTPSAAQVLRQRAEAARHARAGIVAELSLVVPVTV